jgi:hypothetical protein
MTLDEITTEIQKLTEAEQAELISQLTRASQAAPEEGGFGSRSLAEIVNDIGDVEDLPPTLSEIYGQRLGEASLIFPPTGRAAAYLTSRLNAEGADDPREVRKAQDEFDAFKKNMNEERKRSGAAPVF